MALWTQVSTVFNAAAAAAAAHNNSNMWRSPIKGIPASQRPTIPAFHIGVDEEKSCLFTTPAKQQPQKQQQRRQQRASQQHVLFGLLLPPTRWVANMRHGEGTLLHADGSIFRGRFSRDKKTGPGTVTALDGSCYEGVGTKQKEANQTSCCCSPTEKRFIVEYQESPIIAYTAASIISLLDWF